MTIDIEARARELAKSWQFVELAPIGDHVCGCSSCQQKIRAIVAFATAIAREAREQAIREAYGTLPIALGRLGDSDYSVGYEDGEAVGIQRCKDALIKQLAIIGDRPNGK